MAILSGKNGAVDGAAIVRNWNITSNADTQAYVASNTQGGTGRQTGNTDWSGAYSAYGHTPANLPGELFEFKGSVQGTTGAVSPAAGAIVESVEITCDIEGGGILSHVVNFAGNGVLTKGAAIATDPTALIPPSSIGCDAQLGTLAASPVYTALTDVRGWTLTLTSANQPYVTSDTAGGTKRTVGNLDASMSISVYESDLTALPVENDINAIRLFVDATTHWEILWGMFGEISDILVDIETAAVIGATLNASMNGLADIASSDTIGSIKTPAASTFWP